MSTRLKKLEATNKRLSACLICALAIMKRENGAPVGIKVFSKDEQRLLNEWTVLLEHVEDEGYYQASLVPRISDTPGRSN